MTASNGTMTHCTSPQLIACDQRASEIVERLRKEAGAEGKLTVQIDQVAGRVDGVQLIWTTRLSSEIHVIAERMRLQTEGDGIFTMNHYYGQPNNTVTVKWQYRFER